MAEWSDDWDCYGFSRETALVRAGISLDSARFRFSVHISELGLDKRDWVGTINDNDGMIVIP